MPLSPGTWSGRRKSLRVEEILDLPSARLLGRCVILRRGVVRFYAMGDCSSHEHGGQQPLPPTPSPKRRGGAEEEPRALALLPAAGSGCCLSPPLRFGEGVGGRG